MPAMIIPYLLFFLAGLGFGYAAPGSWKAAPFVFPILLALGAFSKYGVEGTIILRLILALVITAIGIVAGAMIDAGGRTREQTA